MASEERAKELVQAIEDAKDLKEWKRDTGVLGLAFQDEEATHRLLNAGVAPVLVKAFEKCESDEAIAAWAWVMWMGLRDSEDARYVFEEAGALEPLVMVLSRIDSGGVTAAAAALFFLVLCTPRAAQQMRDMPNIMSLLDVPKEIPAGTHCANIVDIIGKLPRSGRTTKPARA